MRGLTEEEATALFVSASPIGSTLRTPCRRDEDPEEWERRGKLRDRLAARGLVSPFRRPDVRSPTGFSQGSTITPLGRLALQIHAAVTVGRVTP